MATWIKETYSIASGDTVTSGQCRAVYDGSGAVYFFSLHPRVYKFDGTTVTDISGSYFSSLSNPDVVDLAYWKNNLYVGYNHEDPPGFGFDEAAMGKYNGSSWSTLSLLDENSSSVDFYLVSNRFNVKNYIDYDDTHLVAAVISSVDGRYLSTTDGSSFSVDTVSGTYDSPAHHLFGKKRGSQYPGILGASGWNTANHRAINSPSNWDYLSASGTGALFMGYIDGKSIWSDTKSTQFGLYHSPDWGATLTDAGGPLDSQNGRFRIYDFGIGGAWMIRPGLAGIYKWDTGSNQFVLDADPDGAGMVAMFELGGFVYTMAINGGSGNVAFYKSDVVTGVAAPVARFYSGTNALVERYEMPFALANPDGIAVRPSDKTVVIGGSTTGSSGQVVEKGSNGDNYTTWADVTDNLPTPQPIKALKTI